MKPTRTRFPLAVRLGLLIGLPAALQAASLDLSADSLSSGDAQTLTAQVDASPADIYLVLSSTNGTLRTLKSDGDFAAPGYAVPFASNVSLSEKAPVHAWRVTGLEPATYGWVLVAVRPGGSLKTEADRLDVASAKFQVVPSTAALFAELKEGGARGGDPGARAKGLRRAAPGRAFGGGGAVEADGVVELSVAVDSFSLGITGEGLRAEAAPSVSSSSDVVSGLAADASVDPFASPPPVGASPPPASPSVAPLKPSSRLAGVKKSSAKAAPSYASKRAARDFEDVDKAKKLGGVAVAGRALDGKAALKAKDAAGLIEDADEKKKLEGAELDAARKAIDAAKALTAGVTDDNAAFKDFLTFLQDRNRNSVMAMDISQRRFITVLDADGKHVSNADVTIRHKDKIVFTGRTLANGQTLFHPSAIPDLDGKSTLSVEVSKGLIRTERVVLLDIQKDDKLKNIFTVTKVPKPMPVPNMPLPPCCPIIKCGVGAVDAAPAAADLERRDNWAAAGARAAEAKPAPLTAEAKAWLPDTFAPAAPGSWTAQALNLGAAREPVAKAGGDWIIKLPAAVTPGQPKLDLVFQIDTTGSMRDEIAAVQATLQSVARRIEAMDPQPLVRWGLVLYGDRGDTYVVRRYRFTEDVDEMHQWILNMQMTGGGDTPESALEALHASINEMQWDTGDAIRLVFGIADAPPHLDYNRDYTYIDKMKEAVAKGIKVIPTAASGLDKTGEYIFRQWAQATMGQFLYITYGAGTPAGGPAGKTAHEVTQPEKKNNLDDIIVKVVADEIEAWRSPTFAESGDTEKLERVAVEKK